jgi:hypothetical protein
VKLKNMVRQFNKRILNPFTLSFAGRRRSPYTIVMHVGRKSGRIYATPVVAAVRESRIFIPLPYGEGVDWLRNILAEGGCTVKWNGISYQVGEPEVIDSYIAISEFPAYQQGALKLLRVQKFLSVKHLAEVQE